MSLQSDLKQQRQWLRDGRDHVRDAQCALVDWQYLVAVLRGTGVDRAEDATAVIRRMVRQHEKETCPLDWLRSVSDFSSAVEDYPGAFAAALRDFLAQTANSQEEPPIFNIFGEFLRRSRDFQLFRDLFDRFESDRPDGDAVVEAFRRDLESEEYAPALMAFADRLRVITRDRRDAARADLHGAQRDHVATLVQADGQGDDPLQALEWDHPIALLPVRIETRFDDDTERLQVRVYPDQIHIDAHETPLTDDEYEWGVGFWADLYVAATLPHAEPARVVDQMPTQSLKTRVRSRIDQWTAKTTGSSAERFDQVRERAWAHGVEQQGETRAAYIVHTLSPQPFGDRLLRGYQDDASPLSDVPKLTFPSVQRADASWTHAPTARLLPERWIAYAYYPADDEADTTTDWTRVSDTVFDRRAGREYVRRAASSAILKPVAMLADPTSGEEADEADWLRDFQRAVDVGMGFTIPLPDDFAWRAAGRFSRLVVTGYATALTAEESARELEAVLSAHRYGEGLALHVPGTPTNNADLPSGVSSRKPATAGLDALVGHAEAPDGDHLARALGLSPGMFDHTAGGASQRERGAAAMNEVLWHATLGYFARNLLAAADGDRMLGAEHADGPPEPLRWLESYYHHFVRYVRPGGPLPVLRVERQPYGVLPVTPLYGPDRMNPFGQSEGRQTPINDAWLIPPLSDDPFLPDLISRVDALRAFWQRSVKDVPSMARRDALGKSDLVEMLSQEPVAHTYRRTGLWMGAGHPVFHKLALDARAEESGEKLVALLEQIGVRGHRPRLAELTQLGFSWKTDDLPLADDMGDFINALLPILSHAPLMRLLGALDGEVTANFDVNATLLRQLAWFAALQAMVGSRARVGAVLNDPLRYPPEPLSHPAGGGSVYDALEDQLPSNNRMPPSAGTYADVIQETLDAVRNASGTSGIVVTDSATIQNRPDAAYGRFVDAFSHLGTLSADDAGMLMRETLDAAGHRLDAWWTSIATRRLHALRGGGRRQRGVHIGAYGVVENLAPGNRRSAEYLLAPSLDQATTAAILRGVHKAYVGKPQAEMMRVDLSAERVRRARNLLQGVRRGMTMGQLLGYEVERGLHEANLQRLIHDFRALAPAIEGKVISLANDAPAAAKQSDVVDGVRLYEIWRAGNIPQGLIPDEEDPRKAFDALFERIGNSLDAVHDLLLAEGVHHLAHARPDRAAAALEAMSRGGPPPEDFAVTETPRHAAGCTHRLMVLFGDPGEPRPPSEWRPDKQRLLAPDDLPEMVGNSNVSDTGRPGVRGDAEPYLNAYAGHMLPTPDRVGCRAEFQWRAEYRAKAGTITPPTEAGAVAVNDVGFRPDVIVFSVEQATGSDSLFWSHGIYARNQPDGGASQSARGLSVHPDGNFSGEANTAFFIVDPAQRTIAVRGTVAQTDGDGFVIQLDSGHGYEDLTVRYYALQLPDRTAWRVGQVSAPGTPGSVDVTLGADFAPNHVRFIAGSDAFAGTGDALRENGAFQQRSQTAHFNGPGLRTSDQYIAQSNGARVQLDRWDTNSDPHRLRLTFESPESGAYVPLDLTYIAIESPKGAKPVFGQMTLAADGPSRRRIDLGFRPALMEIVAGDADGGGFSNGVASSNARQHCVSNNTTHKNRLVKFTGTDVDGNEQVTDIRLEDSDDGGAVLRVLCQDHATVNLRYLARPALPDGVAYNVPMDLTLAPLRLAPLDALGLTQRSAEACDSQLERRLAYHAFRRRPTNRPPIPDDATLDLRFTVLPEDPAVDVTVAEFVEAVATLRGVVTDARPADAHDFSTPESQNDPGYIPGPDGTVSTLADRALAAQETLATLRDMMANRLKVYDRDDAPTKQVDALIEALTRFKRTIRLDSLIDPLGTIGNSHGDIVTELRAVADRLRAGDPSHNPHDLFAAAPERATLSLNTEFASGGRATMTVRSLSDAIERPDQQRSVIVDEDNEVAAEFDFTNFPPGTRFTVEVTPSSDGGEGPPDLSDLLREVLEGMEIDRQFEILRTFAERGLLTDAQIRRMEHYPDMNDEERLSYLLSLPRGIGLGLLWLMDVEPPLADREKAILEILREADDIEPQLEIIERFFETGAIPRHYERFLQRYEEAEAATRVPFWWSQSREVQRALLEMYDRAPDEASGSSKVVHASGHVTQPNGGTELVRYLRNDAVVLPALLVVHRWLADLDANPAAWNGLRDAIGNVNAQRYNDEWRLSALIRMNLPGHILRREDIDACRAIDQLLSLDLKAVRDALSGLVEPLRRCGMLRYIAIRGDGYVRTSQLDLESIYPKDAEGRVRARLERLLRMPAATKPAYDEYGLLFRKIIDDGIIAEEQTRALEALLSRPAALMDALSSTMSDAAGTVHAVHRLMHHVHAGLSQSERDDLAGRVDDFFGAFGNRTVVDAISQWNQDAAHAIGRHIDLNDLRDAIQNRMPAGLTNRTADDLAPRPVNARDAVRNARKQIDGAYYADHFRTAFRAGVLEGIRHLLLRASYFGIYGATPASPAGRRPEDEARLLAQMRNVSAKIEVRHQAAKDLDLSLQPNQTVAAQIERLRALFGDAFVVLPPFRPENQDAVGATFANGDQLLAGKRRAPSAWLQRVVHIRGKVAAFQRMRTNGRAFALTPDGAPADVHGRLRVGQLNADQSRWIGRDDVEPTGGEIVYGVSFATTHGNMSPLPPSDASPVSLVGLFIDEWVERTPSADETIGAALHYDEPDARAPQSILLAVPPAWHEMDGDSSGGRRHYEQGKRWHMDAVQDSIRETLALLDLRTVDRSALKDMGHLLPALLMPNFVSTIRRDRLELPPAASVDLSAFNWWR